MIVYIISGDHKTYLVNNQSTEVWECGIKNIASDTSAQYQILADNQKLVVNDMSTLDIDISYTGRALDFAKVGDFLFLPGERPQVFQITEIQTEYERKIMTLGCEAYFYVSGVTVDNNNEMQPDRRGLKFKRMYPNSGGDPLAPNTLGGDPVALLTIGKEVFNFRITENEEGTNYECDCTVEILPGNNYEIQDIDESFYVSVPCLSVEKSEIAGTLKPTFGTASNYKNAFVIMAENVAAEE